MMIKRKISTQKSFRIDNRILEYAQALADSTSRSSPKTCKNSPTSIGSEMNYTYKIMFEP